MTTLTSPLLASLAGPLKATPFAHHLQPMLAVLSTMPPDQAEWGFEYKWDGVRCLAYWHDGSLALESRNLLDITAQYPELQRLRDQLPLGPAVLDGEIVVINDKGRVSFLSLAHRMHVQGAARVAQRASQYPVTFMIFDLLYLDGYSTRELPYTERRRVLEALKLDGPHWRTPPYHPGQGDQVAEAARASRLEGLVAKRLTSVYEPGRRTGAWRKLKFVGRQEFVIGGWLPYKTNDLDMVGALLLGYNDEPAAAGKPLPPLHYAGSVGTGFTEQTRRELAALMKTRATQHSPFSTDPRKPGARFVRPDLLAEVEYRGWSPTGSLRQPSFKGLRSDKDPHQVVRESRWK